MEIADELKKIKDVYNETAYELKSFSTGELNEQEKRSKAFLINILETCDEALAMIKRKIISF